MDTPRLSAGTVGVVVIGRNEGERLHRCLLSARLEAVCVVYVDSGSTDGSVALARSLGVEVVELDPRVPFTAARARNAGFRRLLQAAPQVGLVQFVDGDCELLPDWLPQALAFMHARPDVGLVSGRRRERFPERSIYNRLCDFDWDIATGETGVCGGDFLVRRRVFETVGGFREPLIAGEEPELCVRIRESGWLIWRLPATQSLHDAAMTRFAQWWRRALRGGYAYSEGAYLHGESSARHFVRQHRRILLWGLVLPAAILIAAAAAHPAALSALLLYPLQVVRIASRDRIARDGSALTGGDRWLRAAFFVLSRFPEAVGCCRHRLDLLLKRNASLIEYK